MHAQTAICIGGQHSSTTEAMVLAALSAKAARCASTTACAPLRLGLQLSGTMRQMLPWALLNTIVAYSHQPVGWHCKVCGHRWSAPPHSRVPEQCGCPKCPPRGAVTRHPTFAKCQHLLLEEWDHKRNEACGNYPRNTTLRSGKQIYWLCTKCPAGQEHSWLAEPNNRTGHKQSGCPICAGHVACQCNSLQALFPDIAAEWDHGRNKSLPSDYTAQSHHLAWWYTPQCGSWQQRVDHRTAKRYPQNGQKGTQSTAKGSGRSP